ncbi:MAG: hypothetical protein ACTSPV_07055 [Candidatus Hodarchaeales archaeon]
MNRFSRYDKYSICYLLLVILTLFVIARWIFKPFSEEDYNFISDIEAFLVSFASALILFLVAQKFNVQSVSRKIWLLLAMGSLFWAIGDLSYAFFEIILHIRDPYLFLGDFFWLVGYLFFFLGLFTQFNTIDVTVKKLDVVIFSMLLGFLVIVSSVQLIIPILFDTEVGIAERLLSAAYPTMDLFLAFFAGMIFLKVRGGKISFPWVIMIFSILLSVLADTIYSYLEWYELYGSYNFVDVLFVLEYVILIVAGLKMHRLLNEKFYI